MKNTAKKKKGGAKEVVVLGPKGTYTSMAIPYVLDLMDISEKEKARLRKEHTPTPTNVKRRKK